MSDKPHHIVRDEVLSALMDGEAQELELRRLLQCLPDDPAVRAKWARYQMVSSILHRHRLSTVSLGFADAVQAAIQKEQSFELHNSAAENLRVAGDGWRKSAARFAVAASVALVVVTGVQWQQRMSSTEQVATAIPPSKNLPKPASLEPVASVPLMVSKSLATSAFMPARDQQYERYMQYNLERASLETESSIVPLAPVADRINQEK